MNSPTISVQTACPRKKVWVQALTKNRLQRSLQRRTDEQQGFALLLALGLGLAMTTMAIAAIFVAQSDRSTAVQRKTSGSGLFVAEGGSAGILAQFQHPSNSLLLVRNYDTVNPDTGKTYLGPDGVPNSGDEENAAVDEWAGYDPSSKPCFRSAGIGAPSFNKTGKIGESGDYTLKAYRYDKQKQLGTLFVEGMAQGQKSYLTVTVSVKPDLEEFPGVLTTNAMGKPGLRGRSVFGSTGNVYFPPASSANPSLSGYSAPSDMNRSSYLDAMYSGSSDGAGGDNVEGKIFACQLTPTIPVVPQGANVGAITDQNVSTLNSATSGTRSYQADSTNISLSQSSGNGSILTFDTTGIHYLQASSIDLTSRQTSLKVDTTSGPIYLYVNGPVNLSGNAQIINYRTDGKPPKVGDFRIMVIGEHEVTLRDTACLQDIFLYNPNDDFYFFTSGSGCPSGRNTNFEGVIWMEGILSSKNSTLNRDIPYYPETQAHNFTVVPNATSGIAVPSDLSSLNDVLEYVDWPVRYRIGEVKTWQRVRL
jgi:hypothetical protein